MPTNNNRNRQDADIYHVYVNGEYVGDKSALGSRDAEVQAFDSFLRQNGFDEHMISTQQQDMNVAVKPYFDETLRDMKKALHEYLDFPAH